MALPAALSARLADLRGAPVHNAQSVYGGDINQSARFECGGVPYFVKWNASAPPTMFPTEAHGLGLLDEAKTLRVPAVVEQGDADEACPAFLVLEWIEMGGERGRQTMDQFGAGLAGLHRCTAEQYGLDRDNFIGRLPQPNTRSGSWVTFYGEQRLGFQMKLARRQGRLPARREDLLTRLIARLPDWLVEGEIVPSLLHGDLWGGNYLIDQRGAAVLIDPAVCYGHREMDLAMSELFGGFSPRFYDAYFAAYPAPGYPERRLLYQLYYLLAHLNLFGESFGARVDSIAAYYVGG
jgi:fructosamine-3-kinase